jgi:tetratricopeptide (TPR) repeat protein
MKQLLILGGAIYSLAAATAMAASVDQSTKQALLDAAHKCSGPNHSSVIIESCSYLLNVGFVDDPKMAAITYNNRGTAYIRQNEPERALADFNEAVRLDPAYATAYYNIGKLYAASGFFDRAIEHLDQAVELEPGYVDAYVERGIARAKLKQFDLAMSDFDAALRLRPGDKFVEANRALARRDSKETIKH